MNHAVIHALEACLLAEKEQSLFYRALASIAEKGRDVEMSQRFHDLHADEQHHLSRLSARLLETGHQPPELSGVRAPEVGIDRWEIDVRARERAEIERYAVLLTLELDDETRSLIEEILGVERQHAAELGGKWTPA